MRALLSWLFEDHGTATGLAGFAAAIALGAAAVLVPWTRFEDHASLQWTTEHYLLTEAGHWSDVPALRLQITGVQRIPESEYSLPDATLAWRTIFGVQYGETTIRGPEVSHDWDYTAGLLTWAGFGLAEVVLLSTGFAAVHRAR
ncbi:MAG: hypothetical protein IT303_02410 [Dehalococcoidia bacterium]|nr:hypothetical protein [Dehalococcoidia bacterium]